LSKIAFATINEECITLTLLDALTQQIDSISPDYEKFKTLLFTGAMPDKILNADDLIDSYATIRLLALANKEKAELSFKLQLIEKQEDLDELKEIFKTISEIGIDEYRKRQHQLNKPPSGIYS
ncbi:hypothetical protein UFOVP434_1, partial [uncultured Caudovirales phage]